MVAPMGMMTAAGNELLLRRVLRGDGLFCMASGLLTMLVIPWAEALGNLPPLALAIVGGGTFVYGLSLWRVVGVSQLARLGWTALGLNLVWVVVSWLVLLSGWLRLTSLGWWAIAGLAELVLLIGVVQLVALRRAAR